MNPTPNNWREEDRELFAETIAENFVRRMSPKEMERYVWDSVFDEMLNREWPELWEMAEDLAPELVEQFLSEDSKESQKGSY